MRRAGLGPVELWREAALALYSALHGRHPQRCSPLFALPPDVRLRIFTLAVSAHPDPARPYPFDAYYYRPGYTHAMRTDLALLQTCKRVYAEAREAVWCPTAGNDEMAVWFGKPARRPPACHSLGGIVGAPSSLDVCCPRR